MANCKQCRKLKVESWGASCPKNLFGSSFKASEMDEELCKDYEEVSEN